MDGFYLQAPRYPHGDTNVPATHLVGGTMEHHGHNGQSPHIHAGNEASDPTGTGDRCKHSTHHPNNPRAHSLAPKTAMHRTVDAPATDTTLPESWLTLTRNLAAYIRKHRTARAERWMSWPTDTEQTLKPRTTNLQEHANQLRGMHGPREGQGPAYSIFQRRKAPKPAPKTGTRTTLAKAAAPSRGSEHLGPPSQTAQT